MRFIAFAVCFVLFVSGCEGGEGGAPGDGDSVTGDGDGDATGGLGGAMGSDVEFEDLEGRIRFANFVSDGEEGVNLDLYWGGSLSQSEFVQTIEYGEVTEFFTPRRPVGTLLSELLDPDEARYFLVLEGDTTSLASEFLVLTDESFAAETTLTVAMALGDNSLSAGLVVSSTTILEHVLPVPPDDESYVYGWSGAYNQIPEGDFVLVAADGVCDPMTVGATGNVGQAFVLSPDATGIFLTDANSECATGSTPVTEELEAGHSYILMGKADTFEVDAREAVLLELTVGQ